MTIQVMMPGTYRYLPLTVGECPIPVQDLTCSFVGPGQAILSRPRWTRENWEKVATPLRHRIAKENIIYSKLTFGSNKSLHEDLVLILGGTWLLTDEVRAELVNVVKFLDEDEEHDVLGR